MTREQEINNIKVSLIDYGFTRPQVLCFREQVGTPMYLAPEIILGLRYTAKVDTWAIGVMLFQMVVGQVPFTYDHGGMASMYRGICFESIL